MKSHKYQAAAAQLPDAGRFIALDSLRGIAALAVVAYHLGGGGLALDSTIVRHGAYSVDFFFVLSGFVISGAYGKRLSKGFSPLRYMALRAGRIVPLHVAILLIFLAHEIALGVLGVTNAGTRPVFTGDKALGPFLATLFLVQSFLVPTPTGWNGPSWSISVEMWLYLGIALAWRWLGRSAPVLVGLAAVSALVLLASGFEGWRTPLSPAVCHGVAGFGLGTLCWNAWEGRAGRSLVRSSHRLATVAELVLVATVVAILSMPDNPRTIIVLDLLFSAGVIVFAAQRGYISRMLCLRPFVAVGTLSYSIYLVHGVVVFYLAHLLARLGWVTLFPGKEVFFVISTPASLVDLVGLGMILASVAAAWFTWRFIERPARDWSRRRASLLGIGLEERRAPTM